MRAPELDAIAGRCQSADDHAQGDAGFGQGIFRLVILPETTCDRKRGGLFLYGVLGKGDGETGDSRASCPNREHDLIADLVSGPGTRQFAIAARCGDDADRRRRAGRVVFRAGAVGGVG